GEIVVRSDTIFKGYFKDPEATAAALTEDGWFRTGDVGELDEDGFLKITDRKKDLIITAGGKNISPQNLENALKASRFVSQALVPISALRLLVGALLLAFGLQWLRKAILRASGYKALHDEDAIFAREIAEAQTAAHEERAGLDWYGFTLSFKGVLLEGLEVAFIVLTFGSTQGSIWLAALGAGIALVLVAVVGFLVRAPLTRVPENTLKFAVGVMLTTFGTFWAVEG